VPRLSRTLLALLVAIALLPRLAAAQAPAEPQPRPQPWAARPYSLEFGIGMDGGGDKLLTLKFTDGSSESLYADQGFYFYAGVAFARFYSDEVAFDTAVKVAVKGWNVGSGGDEVRYLVFPLEAVERLWIGQFRLGGGLTYLVNPEISGNGALDTINASLDNSLGFTVQADWIGERKPGRAGVAIGLRYNVQELKFQQGSTVSANGIGLRLGFEF
jgi:hypothetical protein